MVVGVLVVTSMVVREMVVVPMVVGVLVVASMVVGEMAVVPMVVGVLVVGEMVGVVTAATTWRNSSQLRLLGTP